MSGQNDKPSESDLRAFILSALEEAQDNIRAFDTKAQIVGVGYIFAINIVRDIGSLNPDAPVFSPLVILLGWFVVVVPIILFGAVLYPSRKMAPSLGKNTKQVKKLYYVPKEYYTDPDTYIEEINKCDVNAEFSYELMKLSALRDLKRKRFLRALFAAGGSFILLFATQIFRALS